MATKYVQFKGKSHFFKNIWADRIDREFEDPANGKGGNWNAQVKLDDDSVKLFNAIGTRSKLKDGNRAMFRRYEFQTFDKAKGPEALGPVKVTGVDEGTLIGNDSDVTVTVEVYDYTFKNKPGKGLRLVEINVDNLIPYEKPVGPTAEDNLPPVH
jgi:hypothetical protein